MARGMELPECYFCQNHNRQGQDNIVRESDTHICLKHQVIIPLKGGMRFVCSDFDYDGAETGLPGSIKASSVLKPGFLYSYPSPYYEIYKEVAEFAELKNI